MVGQKYEALSSFPIINEAMGNEAVLLGKRSIGTYFCHTSEIEDVKKILEQLEAPYLSVGIAGSRSLGNGKFSYSPEEFMNRLINRYFVAEAIQWEDQVRNLSIYLSQQLIKRGAIGNVEFKKMPQDIQMIAQQIIASISGLNPFAASEVHSKTPRLASLFPDIDIVVIEPTPKEGQSNSPGLDLIGSQSGAGIHVEYIPENGYNYIDIWRDLLFQFKPFSSE